MRSSIKWRAIEAATIEDTLASAAIFQKQTLIFITNFNEDYVINTDRTAQYAITLSAKILPKVFVCLQEATGHFGPRVQKAVDFYASKYTNIVVTSSKSGKLTTILYTNFLKDCLKSYVGNEQFFLIIDSWGGQTKPELYDEIFQDDDQSTTCTIKVIPQKCTSLVQPCDVYFYRQVKNLIKRMQNCAYLIEQNREINSRED
ncbi:hypothetical protein M0804_015154 [Polistes exclamans]|nr:hypothetical protein M0804_015154 [Polistes exclamans]